MVEIRMEEVIGQNSSILSKNSQHCFAYNSATKHHSEAVLYSKQTAGYPLSPHIKTIAVAVVIN